ELVDESDLGRTESADPLGRPGIFEGFVESPRDGQLEAQVVAGGRGLRVELHHPVLRGQRTGRVTTQGGYRGQSEQARTFGESIWTGKGLTEGCERRVGLVEVHEAIGHGAPG